jgi:hypothetical protein
MMHYPTCVPVSWWRLGRTHVSFAERMSFLPSRSQNPIWNYGHEDISMVVIWGHSAAYSLPRRLCDSHWTSVNLQASMTDPWNITSLAPYMAKTSRLLFVQERLLASRKRITRGISTTDNFCKGSVIWNRRCKSQLLAACTSWVQCGPMQPCVMLPRSLFKPKWRCLTNVHRK